VGEGGPTTHGGLLLTSTLFPHPVKEKQILYSLSLTLEKVYSRARERQNPGEN